MIDKYDLHLKNCKKIIQKDKVHNNDSYMGEEHHANMVLGTFAKLCLLKTLIAWA